MSQIIICKNEFDVEVSKSNENELLANDHHVPFSVHIFDDILVPIFFLWYFLSPIIFSLYCRRRVIASLQSVIMYEYLPSFLGQELSPYAGYKPDTHPGISHVFQSAAFRLT